MVVVANRSRRSRCSRQIKSPAFDVHERQIVTYSYLVDIVNSISEAQNNVFSGVFPTVVTEAGDGSTHRPPTGNSATRRDPSRSRSRGPGNAFEKHLAELHSSEQFVLEGYASRIDHLRTIVEEEGSKIDSDSERDFWDFVHRHPFTAPGQLVVTNEGHLRLVWRGAHDAHIGIRFLGRRRIRYVMFNRRAGARDLLETSGEDTFTGVVRNAHACDLNVFRA